MAWPEVFAEALAGVRMPVRAGEFVFHEGDEADAMFIVRSGRLEAIAGTPPRVVRVLGRGDAVGELALLTGSTPLGLGAGPPRQRAPARRLRAG